MTKDLEYYSRREAQHRTLAAATSDMTAHKLHLQMAELYAQRLKVLVPEIATQAA